MRMPNGFLTFSSVSSKKFFSEFYSSEISGQCSLCIFSVSLSFAILLLTHLWAKGNLSITILCWGTQWVNCPWTLSLFAWLCVEVPQICRSGCSFRFIRWGSTRIKGSHILTSWGSERLHSPECYPWAPTCLPLPSVQALLLVSPPPPHLPMDRGSEVLQVAAMHRRRWHTHGQ